MLIWVKMRSPSVIAIESAHARPIPIASSAYPEILWKDDPGYDFELEAQVLVVVLHLRGYLAASCRKGRAE